MADYQDIRGLRVKYLSADPGDPPSGEVWYNSTTGTLKTRLVGGAWSSGTVMPAARNAAAYCGIQTAALAAAGGPGTTNTTVAYNGLGWTTGGNATRTNNSCAGAGTTGAAIKFAGNPPGTTSELYDGSTWTNGPAYNDDTYASRGAGTQTAALKVSGFPTPLQGDCEEFNGTSWTETGNIGSNITVSGTTGIQTAAVIGGGLLNNAGGGINNSFTFDGATWTAGNTINTTRSHLCGFGTQTAAIIAGGQLGYTPGVYQSAVENYDGTTWTTNSASLATARADPGCCGGTATAGLVAGGGNPGSVAVTEEYNVASTIITPAAWASGVNLPVTTSHAGGAGTTEASLVFGGYTPPAVNTTLEGTPASWTAGGSMGTARAAMAPAKIGSQTAALTAAGSPGSAPYASTLSEEYNGTGWTEGSNANIAVNLLAGTGTQTAALKVGGELASPSYGESNSVEEYNGASWTSVTAIPTVIRNCASAGSQTAALIAGGMIPGITGNSYEYNGASWSAGGVLSQARQNTDGGTGATDATGLFGGGQAAGTTWYANTEEYNGTAFFTRPAMAIAKADYAGLGVNTSALAAGGRKSPAYTKMIEVEEFTGDTTSANIKTLTTS